MDFPLKPQKPKGNFHRHSNLVIGRTKFNPDRVDSTPRPYPTFIVGSLVLSSSAGTKSSVLVLFCSAKIALNASVMFNPGTHMGNKG